MPTKIEKIDRFAEKVLHCAKTQCPFHQTRPGAYPKFSYGNARADVMAVFQNPGQPTFQERRKTIKMVSVEEMRQWANSGLSNWLKKYRIHPSELEYGARSFLDSYYMTQSYRCPDPLGGILESQKSEAREQCLAYLRQEIAIVQPKVILCFGNRALQSVKDILSPSSPKPSGIATLFDQKRIFEWDGKWVFPLIHPAARGQYSYAYKRDRFGILRWYVDQIKRLRVVDA